MKQLRIRVWACPADQCRSYYGSSSQAALDLTAEANLESDLSHGVDHDPAHPRVTGNRGQCPDCRQRGVTTQRVPVDAVITVGSEQPVPPPHAVATPR